MVTISGWMDIAYSSIVVTLFNLTATNHTGKKMYRIQITANFSNTFFFRKNMTIFFEKLA